MKMKKLLIVGLILGTIFISGCINENESYDSVSWDKIYDKNFKERIVIEGYLTDAVQYPTSIFRESENYLYLSPNNDYPLQGQIPLIVHSSIDCSGKIQVYGIIVLREGSAGMGIEGMTNYTLLKVDKWNCITE